MGRTATFREPVQRAALQLLTSASDHTMRQRELFAGIRERTGAADGTIRKWARPLCELDKRGRPGEADATWLWRLKSEIAGIEPKIAGIEPKIMGTGAASLNASKMMRTATLAGDLPKARSSDAQGVTCGHPPEMAGTGWPLLDADQRSESERQVALEAFGECLGSWICPLHAVTLTWTKGRGCAGAVAGLWGWVTSQGGGMWLVPHVGDNGDSPHYHGVLARLCPLRTLDTWIAFHSGAAARDAQRAEPIHDLPGWLAYCRREPGFDLSSVIVAGSLLPAWAWAQAHVGRIPPEPSSLAALPVDPP